MVSNLTAYKKWIKPAVLVMCSLGCIGIAYLLANFIYFILDRDSYSQVTPALPVSDKRQINSGSASRNVNVASMNLFGVVNSKPKQAKPAPVVARKTKLNFKLKGVFTAPTQEESAAIIQFGGGATDEGYFQVGQVIKNGVKLTEVHPGKVILDNRGSIEALEFPTNAGGGAGFSVSGGSGSVRQPPKSNASRPKSAASNRSNKNSGIRPQDIKTPEDFVKVAKKQLADDPQQALASVGLEQIDGAGGYRVGKQASMLKSFGLKEGDIIQSINGTSVGDVQSDQSLFDQVMSDGKVRIEVQRGSRRFVINQRL